MTVGNYVSLNYTNNLYCFRCNKWITTYRDINSSLDKVKKPASIYYLRQLFFRACPSCGNSSAIYWPEIGLFIKLSNSLQKLDMRKSPEIIEHNKKIRQLGESVSRLLSSDFSKVPKSETIRDINLVASILASWGEIEFSLKLLDCSLNTIQDSNWQMAEDSLALHLETITLLARIESSARKIALLHEAVAISLFLNDWCHAFQNLFELSRQLLFDQENYLSYVNYGILTGLETSFNSVHNLASQYLDLTILHDKYIYTISDSMLKWDIVDMLKDEYEIFDIEFLLRRAEKTILAGRTSMAIKMLESVLVSFHRLRDTAGYSTARLKVTSAIRPIKEQLITLHIYKNDIPSAIKALAELKTGGFVSDLDALNSHATHGEQHIQRQVFHELPNKLWGEQFEEVPVALKTDKNEIKDEPQLVFDLVSLLQDLDDHVLYADFFVAHNAIFVFLIKKEMPQVRVKEVNVNVLDMKNLVISSFADKDKVKNVSEFELARLSNILLTPLFDHLGDDDIVCIIPDSFLHLIPFHALPINGQPLVVNYPVFYLPSLLLKSHLKKKQLDAAEITLIMGDSHLDLKQAQDESIKVGKILAAEPFIGSKATKEVWEKFAPTADIIHLACHGKYNAVKPLRSYIKLSDGFLYAEDIYLKPLRANLLVLSSCQSGVSWSDAYNDYFGLVRAFLMAGLSSVVASLWHAEDDAAKEIIVDFYLGLHYQRLSKVRALQYAIKNNLKDQEKREFWHWSPFVLIGDPT